jgi:hypothetical protein
MAAFIRVFLLSLASPVAVTAAPPPPLAKALEFLREQKSYSWEVINADPGPVAQKLQTRRGTITTVQQNLSPHLKGSIDLNGDMLIQREWSDGLRLDTVITADGGMITKTPEGWMTNQEVLTAQAEERLQGGAATPRFLWLRRADRPDVRRPDQELVPFLNASGDFVASGDSYVVQRRIRPEGSSKSSAEDATPAAEVILTMNLRSGLIRDYELKIEGTQPVTRARLPVKVSDQRIVIITYLPVSRIAIPDDARAKLKALSAPGFRR